MFKLQRLEITGFKSFADYTEIIFTGSGITAVVGPNGCGKSNVSDCISWVLGEQRAKSLRGGEMKDVVFQGSKNRKPGGMAEVVLHMVRDDDDFDVQEKELEDIDQALSSIDESAVDMEAIESFNQPEELIADEGVGNGFHAGEVDLQNGEAVETAVGTIAERTIKTKRHWRPRSIGLEFTPGETVSVTRRLYLSGESEYQLNGKSCRLRDIQDLFAGTGLSGAHYAIIEQGRIGQILSAKPSDRRSLIEEAAGISKFRTRQRAAETRLDSAKNNLSRISDIVSEIDKHASSLRRQATKTRRFVVLQDEFRVLLRQLFAAEGKHLSERIGALEKQLALAVGSEKELIANVAQKEVAVQETTKIARVAEELLAETRSRHAANALERDRSEREFRYQSEQITAFDGRLNTLRDEGETTRERLKLADGEIKRLSVEDEKESSVADTSRLILVEAEQVYAGKLAKLREIESELEASRGELMKHTAAAERFDEIERQLNFNFQRLTERRDGLKHESLRATEALKGHKTDGEKLAVELETETKKLQALQAEKRTIFDRSAEYREILKQSETILREIQQELGRNQNRFETLQELEEKRAVYAPQVQKIFAAQETIGVQLTGVLADFLTVDERAENAIESLMGDFLQTILVENIADAKKVAAWLRSNNVGRIAVLILPKATVEIARGEHKSNKMEGLLGISDEFIRILKQVVPREMAAELVDDLETANGDEKSVFVDNAGNLLVAGKLFIAGNKVAEGKNASLLAFKRELSTLGKSIDKFTKEIEKAEKIAAKDRKNLAEAEEKIVDLQSYIIQLERGLLGLEARVNATRQEVERSERHQQVVVAESKQIDGEITEIVEKIQAAKLGGKNAQQTIASVQVKLLQINEAIAKARAESDAENVVLNEKRTMAATSGERRRSVQSALRRVENEKKELEMRIGTIEREVGEIKEKIGVLQASRSDLSKRIEDSGGAEQAEMQETEAAILAVTSGREKADAVSRELAEMNHNLASALNERGAVEVLQTEAVTQLKNVGEKCLQELNTPLARLVDEERFDDEFDLEAARSGADDLRNKLDSFGAINMLAVEELTETEERLLFLTSQRQDIIDGINSAEEALREIKERSRAKFKEAFEAVNTNFIQFFQELFGGGRGEMTLLESDDILEAGIEVVAQPPGKRLQNILLLSGGEKAMTAIALILAIFKYRPSPFCLLDEVDAPLDDANVGRFVDKIAEMSEKTQFIVITHNKRTMEAAKALYGVTMQEAGVSKVVSVKFE